MQWRIDGSDNASGAAVTLLVDADTAETAIGWAVDRGVQVASVTNAEPTPTTVAQPADPLDELARANAYQYRPTRRARRRQENPVDTSVNPKRVALVLMCIAGICVILLLLNEWVQRAAIINHTMYR